MLLMCLMQTSGRTQKPQPLHFKDLELEHEKLEAREFQSTITPT